MKFNKRYSAKVMNGYWKEKNFGCTIKHFCGISMVATGFSRKKLYLLRISIFLKLTPWISSQIYRDPPSWNFPFFCIDPPGNPFFPLFLVYPLEFQQLNSTPWNFSINILNRGLHFFSGKPITISNSKKILKSFENCYYKYSL